MQVTCTSHVSHMNITLAQVTYSSCKSYAPRVTKTSHQRHMCLTQKERVRTSHCITHNVSHTHTPHPLPPPAHTLSRRSSSWKNCATSLGLFPTNPFSCRNLRPFFGWFTNLHKCHRNVSMSYDSWVTMVSNIQAILTVHTVRTYVMLWGSH